ncbi:hypothetical protein [Amycolatopsis sp. EV170708-02-1]|uniref:hypothetical protein n=1 Tax=Amycolatopsis sp. EV170708-02-1 TaxID=2919322 RepID=UPI001F0C89E2|nr:hypothetical protein [Amycolatopsis sp. EV170708-02-1]UMP02244.1 hypothetical protein MJQ72_38595 [Amycolatopsis sp. EV170708-02-1]
MVEEQFAVYLRQTRERAVRQMQAAQDVMGEWLDLVRQCTETRLDSFEAEDVTADPAYREALRLYARVAASVGWFAHRAPAIEAGEGE